MEKIDKKDEYACVVIDKYEIYLSMDKSINLEMQSEKIRKEIDNLVNYLSGLDKKLANTNFLNKASAKVISMEKQKQSEAREKLAKLQKLV